MTNKTIQSIPVVRATARDYELAALVGDDAVILGWTMADTIDRSDLLGFGVKRMRKNPLMRRGAECRWLGNHRRFAFHDNDAGSNEYSTQSDPLQQFYFLDYAVETGFSYTYSVVPIRGTPNLKYFEPPISVTVHPQEPWPSAAPAGVSGMLGITSAAADYRNDFVNGATSAEHEFVTCAHASQDRRNVATQELAAMIEQLTDQARSAVFLYSSVPLPSDVTGVIEKVNSGRLLYGVVPQDKGRGASGHKTVLLSAPASPHDLRQLTFRSRAGGDRLRYTSALVTDPWSRHPQVLLWSDTPRASAPPVVGTRLIRRDKRSAASLATYIFQAYTKGRLPSVQNRSGRRVGTGSRNLEPDGRWSNIYFNKHAANHKYREREIFSGHP